MADYWINEYDRSWDFVCLILLLHKLLAGCLEKAFAGYLLLVLCFYEEKDVMFYICLLSCQSYKRLGDQTGGQNIRSLLLTCHKIEAPGFLSVAK